MKDEPVIDKSMAKRIATQLGWEPKKEWVNLTDEDVVQVFNVVIEENKGWPERRYRDFAKYIEAKLKEKNT